VNLTLADLNYLVVDLFGSSDTQKNYSIIVHLYIE